MKTTNLQGGRNGDLCAETVAIEETLRKARRLFDMLSAKLEEEIDRLQFIVDDRKADEARVKDVLTLMNTVRSAMQTVVSIEEKLIGKEPVQVSAAVVIDLDEARAEIESRLARLAA